VRGVVDSVHEIELREVEDLARQYEHPLVPEVGWRIAVHLDDGADITVTYVGERRYAPGDRVRLFRGSDGTPML